MNCLSCDSKKKMKSEIITHRFKESGLDHVILEGVKNYRCEKCGETYFDFGDINKLHQVISEALLIKKGLLTGREIRFLRSQIGYSSEMFAKILGFDKTSWSRIENERSKISSQVNMSVRWAIAGKMVDRNYDMHDLILSLETDQFINFNNIHFKTSHKNGWYVAKAS